jgi:hypothetical protein
VKYNARSECSACNGQQGSVVGVVTLTRARVQPM